MFVRVIVLVGVGVPAGGSCQIARPGELFPPAIPNAPPTYTAPGLATKSKDAPFSPLPRAAQLLPEMCHFATLSTVTPSAVAKYPDAYRRSPLIANAWAVPLKPLPNGDQLPEVALFTATPLAATPPALVNAPPT